MQRKNRMLGVFGVVVMMMLIIGCTVEPKKDEPKTYSFLGTEWVLTSVTFLDGSTMTASSDPSSYSTVVFSKSEAILRDYTNGVVTNSMSVPLSSVDDTHFVSFDADIIFDDTDPNQTKFYIGSGTYPYTVSGDSLTIGRGTFIGTNVDDPNDSITTNKVWLFSSFLPIKSLNLKAKE